MACQDTFGKFFKSFPPHPGDQPVPTLSVPVEPPLQQSPTLSVPSDVPEMAPPQLSQPVPPPLMPPPQLSLPAVLPDQSATEFAVSAPEPIPFEPPPVLSSPEPVKTQPAPTLTVPSDVPFQPAPTLTGPAAVPLAPPPVLTVPSPVPFEPPPVLTAPTPVPFEPAPPLTIPPVIPFEPAPPLTTPPVIPFEPAPPLTTPPVIPFEPAPPLTTPLPIPFEPAPPLTAPAVIPFEPAPPLTDPAVIPFEPAPPYVVPKPIPFEPPPPLTDPANIPFQNPPPLTNPAPIPPPPESGPPPVYNADIIIRNDLLAQPIIDAGSVGLVGLTGLPGAFIPPIPIGAHFGIDHAGRINAGLDVHLEHVIPQTLHNIETFAKAQAQAYVQRNLNTLVHNATTVLNSALDSINPFRAPSPKSRRNIARNAPGGNLIGLPAPDQGQPPNNHDSPELDPLETLDVPPADPDFDYVTTSRQQTQAIQEAAAEENLQLMDDGNSWNNNFTYQDQESKLLSSDLQKSFSVATDGYSSDVVQGSKGPDEAGFFPFNGSEQSLPSDDSVYVPLVFTDLRPNKREYRSVYFKPFIKSLSENFAPNWNLGNYFGRVDPVATYKSTNRTINLSFKITCFEPEDLAANYRKLAWLSSMCYPEYKGGAYFAGPVVRLRVGDVISAIGGVTGKGISGILTSLDINYDEGVWNIEANQKLPRDITVSVGFHVLHDHAIGIVDGQFGGVNGAKANIRQFRAAFGSTEYLNEPVPAGPGSAMQFPNIVPAEATEIPGYSNLGLTQPPFSFGTQPNIEVDQATAGVGWAGGNADTNLGIV